MISALLGVLLTVAPDLESGERAARLVTDPALPTLELMTKQQLENELLRLQTTRPRLLGPIILISAGTVVAVAGLVLLNAGAALVFSKPALVATFLLSAGSVFLLGGIVAALIGIVLIGRRLAERRALNRQTDEVEKRLDTLERLSHHEWLSSNTAVLATF